MEEIELSEHFQAFSSAQVLVFWPVLGCCGPSPRYAVMTELNSNIEKKKINFFLNLTSL